MEAERKEVIKEQMPKDILARKLKRIDVKRVELFVLGPEGTNISQAAWQWAFHNDILDKTNFVYCGTPEEEIELAGQVKEDGIMPIFTLCAVYYNLHKLFFKYTDYYFFLSHYYMNLDNMQLAATVNSLTKLPEKASVASHYSPAILVEDWGFKIEKANSNSHAAKMCRDGEVDACITTETAKNIYNLNKLHDFGSPKMLFTFGTTSSGFETLSKIK